jgi:Spy/CpxP family protein refolding chaperone
MKRKALWTVVGLVLVVVAVATARANFREAHGWCGQGWSHRGPLGYVAREINLSSTQISQIRSIWTEERPTVAALLEDLLDGSHQMADATAGSRLDEEKVRAIATAEGNTLTKLLIEREHIKSRIYTIVLNAEQRQSADKLQQRWLGRLDNAVSRLKKQTP